MKYLLIFSLIGMSSFASAMECDYPAETLYHCTSEKLEVCIAESSRDDVLYRIEANKINPSGWGVTFEQRSTVRNNKRKLSISYKQKLLLLTLRSVKFHLNKKSMKASFRVRDFNLGIGDGPHFDASIPLTELTCVDLRKEENQ